MQPNTDNTAWWGRLTAEQKRNVALALANAAVAYGKAVVSNDPQRKGRTT